MQTALVSFWYVILIAGFAVQSVWMVLTRIGREQYIRSITSFQKPSSPSGRYYGWHLSRPRNAAIEGALLDVVLVLLVFYLALALADIYAIIPILPILFLVLLLSSIVPFQTASRIGGLAAIERKLYDNVSASADKVGQTRVIIENLLSPAQIPDGRYWFALFRIALREDPVGWSVRDVLMEKARDLDLLAERVRRGERVPLKSTDTRPGAEIE